ncbi:MULTISPECIES: YrhK family protein [unclassified Pseudoalteromonas]|uniref:YrhK family protein n=1 Tax=unclassified Pseudoalteromonas TaxID=194690 RepID=UPI0013FE051F|nr:MULTISPECIES: YrhK family protein [unclassified Pseudoalteromonas]
MDSNSNQFILDLGQEHITIQRRYEALGAFNDFLIGSFFFLNDSLIESGTWLFIAGSAQLLIKPVLKLISLVHVSRVFHSNKTP